MVEYTACALFDMTVHSLAEYGDDFDLAKFEKDYPDQIGKAQGIVMRHSSLVWLCSRLFCLSMGTGFR